MSLKKYTVTLATTAALVGAGLTVPNALAEDAGTGAVPAAAQAAPQDPVDGFSWPDVEVVAGGEVTITPSKTAGEKYRFVGSADGSGYTFDTDEKTGVITAKAPVNGYPGNSITITTQVHKLNADKSAYEKVGEYKSTITIKAGGDNDANTHEISYDKLTVKEGQSATANRKGDIPSGTSFSIEDKSDHIDASVDAQGNVTVTPKPTVGAGSTAAVAVKVTYPDTSYEYAQFNVIVADENGNTTPHKDRDVAKYDPEWAATDMNGNAGVATTAKQTKEVPAGTTFAVAPDYAKQIAENLEVSFNDNGDLTATPKAPLQKDAEIQIPVEITYPDGTSEQKIATFTVTEEGKFDSQKATVTYPAITTPADKAGTSTPTKTNVPAGTKFSSNSKLPEGWSFDVDEATGEATVTAPKNTAAGTSLDLQVRANFPDGSSTTYPLTFTTTEPENKLADAHEVTYPASTVTSGESITIDPSVSPAAPEGTTFHGPAKADKSTIAVDEKTGTITVTAPKEQGAGTADLPITVRFPDGTTKEVTAALTIKAAKSSTTPTSPTEPTKPSQPTTPTEPTKETPTKESPTTETTPTEPTKPTTPTEPTTTETTTTSTTTTPEEEPGDNGGKDGSSSSNGSSTGGIIGIVLLVLGVLGGLGVAAWNWMNNNGGGGGGGFRPF